MGSTHSSTWKKFELCVAKFFETDRTPLSGMAASLSKADTLHPRFFIECKLRQDFAIIRHYKAAKKTLKGEGIDKPLVFRITNFQKYRGDLWLFEMIYWEQLLGTVNEVKDTEGNPRMVMLANKFHMDRTQKADTLCNLYSRTNELAEREDKLPIVAIKMKGSIGWYIVVDPSILGKINQFYIQHEHKG